MKRILLAVCLCLALFAGVANARDASSNEMRMVNAALADLRGQGVDIPTPTVKILTNNDTRPYGITTNKWYAAADDTTLYFHDSSKRNLDAQNHLATVGAIMIDPVRTSRTKRMTACLYCDYIVATVYHELVHFARFQHETFRANDRNFEEGLAEAVAYDRTRPFCKTAFAYQCRDFLSDTYLPFTKAVRAQSARATGSTWGSVAATQWRMDQVREVADPPIPPSDPAPGNYDPPVVTPPAPVPPLPPSSSSWSSWQWQLTGTLQLGLGVSVYDVDGESTSAAEVAAIHAQGAQAICYISAGSWEDWRSDAGSFPASVLGASNGWPGERWLDIRRWDVLGPIMSARMAACKAKGFDHVEPDNIDGYTNSTGFPLSAADQLSYNANLSIAAHNLGLGIGLKNDVDQIGLLEPWFDWAINEQCFQYDECGAYKQFSDAGKAVLITEYNACPSGYDPRWLVIKKDLNLGAGRQVCTP